MALSIVLIYSTRFVVVLYRISLYPTTIASFRKYRQEKLKYRTDAEVAQKSWVFKPLVDVFADVESVNATANSTDKVI
jgi:hypothetical protein